VPFLTLVCWVHTCFEEDNVTVAKQPGKKFEIFILVDLLLTWIIDGSLGNMHFRVSLLSKFVKKLVELNWHSIKVMPGKGLKYTF
jgi:hypothetical protein